MHMHATPGNRRTQRILQFSLVATFAYVLLTALAGIRANSLALLSEAGHNLSDFFALGLSFLAVYLQSRPANERKTYGYQRAGVLAAFVNALALVVLSVWLAVEAFHRLAAPVAVQPRIMMVVAAAGVVMNGAIALLLSRMSHDLNLRSVFLHMLGDTLSTAAVILGGAAIFFTGIEWIDPALSLLISALILWSSYGIVRETANILLEGTPRGLSLAAMREAMQQIPGVEDVHDLHAWSLGSSTNAISCHITIADIPPSASNVILEEINCLLHKQFRIHHTTVQFELDGCEAAVHGCQLPGEEDAHPHSSHDHKH
jgi:cobalt-zinc-cadmium efflux system protein